MVSKTIVNSARMIDSNAARACGKASSAMEEPARRTISGLMLSYPSSTVADMAQRPVIKVMTVRENSVGSRVGSTTLSSTLKGLAPRLRAASTVL